MVFPTICIEPSLTLDACVDYTLAPMMGNSSAVFVWWVHWVLMVIIHSCHKVTKTPSRAKNYLCASLCLGVLVADSLNNAHRARLDAHTRESDTVQTYRAQSRFRKLNDQTIDSGWIDSGSAL